MSEQSHINRIAISVKRFLLPASCAAREQLTHLENVARDLASSTTSFNTDVSRLMSHDPVTKLARNLSKSKRRRRAS